jgi:hypothetical protein
VEKVKASVVGVAAGALSAVGVDCDDTCHKALETGLEVGMVAMGLPPSLPNADQLMHAGVDYLADMAAEQAGVPPEIAEALAQHGKEFITAVAQDLKAKQTTPGLPDWVIPDIGLDPAVITLYLHAPGWDLGGYPGVALNYSPIFLGSGPDWTPLPRTFTNLFLPMVLQPNLEGLPLIGNSYASYSDYDVARWNKQHWVNERLNNGCARFYALAKAPGTEYEFFSINLHADQSYLFPPIFGSNFSACVP